MPSGREVYRPSAVVRLRVRLDDPSDYGHLRSVLEAHAIQAGLDAGVLLAAIRPGDAEDALAVLADITPQRVVVNRNSLHEADTCSVVLDWNWLPLDPRDVRSLAVEVYLGGVSADAFGRGMAGPDNRRRDALVETSRKNLRFVGWADDGAWRVQDGELDIEARCLQALLMDSKVPGDVLGSVDLNTTLEDVVRNLVNASPLSRNFKVVATEETPSIGSGLPTQFTRIKGKGKRPPLADTGESYWEIINKLSTLAGWVAEVDLDVLRLRPANNLWVESVNGEIAGAGSGEDLPRMIWGGNLASLEFARPWGEVLRRPVEARCWLPGKNETLVARFPVSPVAAKVAPSGKVATEEVDVIRVEAVADHAALSRIAQSFWIERLADLRGSFTTRELRSWDEDEASQNLLGCKFGTPVEIRIARNLVRSSTPELYTGLARPEFVELLRKRGLDSIVADRIAAVAKGRERLPIFRVQSAEHTFDADEGYELSVEFLAILRGGVDGEP